MKKIKEVQTISGEIVAVQKTKREIINGDVVYYKIGNIKKPGSGDIYRFSNTFVKADDPSLVLNHTTNTLDTLTLNKKLIKGVIGFTDQNEIIEGYFEKNPLNVYFYDDKKYLAISEKILNDNLNYRENISDGIFLNINSQPASMFNIKKNIDRQIKEGLAYSLDLEKTERVKNLHENFYQPSKYTESVINNLFKGYSFGFEFETTKGVIPWIKSDIAGLVPLRDGSIAGLEYVSLPIHESKALPYLYDTLSLLKKYTEFNQTCSTHVHIGGVPRTKEFILAYFRMLSFVQDEMFNLFPLYKKNSFGYKQKEYTKPYELITFNMQMDEVIDSSNIDKNFNVIFKYLSEGSSFKNYGNSLDNVKVHPRDPENRAKWHIHTRYHLINFIPLIFGNKKTIEFRLHNPTFNREKLMCFVTLNTVLLRFVEVYQDKLLNDSKLIFNAQQNLGSRTYLGAILRLCRSSKIIDSSIESTLMSYYNGEHRKYNESNRRSEIFKDIEESSENQYGFIYRFLKNNLKKPSVKSLDFGEITADSIPEVHPFGNLNMNQIPNPKTQFLDKIDINMYRSIKDEIERFTKRTYVVRDSGVVSKTAVNEIKQPEEKFNIDSEWE